MLNMTDAMVYAMDTPGALAVAFVEFKTARAVAGFGEDKIDFDRMTPDWTELLLAQTQHLDAKEWHNPVNDVVVTTNSRHHVLRPLRDPAYSDMYLYLVLDKNAGSIPLARYRLHDMEDHLAL